MAVTTLTSVGFMEVRPLSAAGRAFAMVLIAFGISGLGIWWGLITALIVELDLRELIRGHRMMREIASLSDHFIVCGIGNMGRAVVDEMDRSSVPCVVIERDPARIKAIQEERPDWLVIEGDATKEHRLHEARIESARGLAACLTDDADNLLLCLTARGLKKDLTIVARAHEEEALDKLRRAGANHAISPNVTGGIRMASTLIRPSVVCFLDVTTTGMDMELRLEEAQISPSSSVAGKSLAEAQIPQRTGLIVLALRQAADDSPIVYNPGPETRLQPGDVMIVLGRQQQVAGLREYINGA